MGIYDRDYVRRRPAAYGGGGGGGAGGLGGVQSLRMVSANTWIIVICVAVFVIDGFLPQRWVGMQTELDRNRLSQVDSSQIIEGEIQVLRTDARGRPIIGSRPLLVQTRGGTVEVGRQMVQTMGLLESWLHFSTERGFLKLEFWRLIGFQFLHANVAHILFNMLGLFFFGPMVERYLGSKRYLAFYLLCGIFGALMYVTLNVGGIIAQSAFNASQFPILLFTSTWTPLIGASAGVFGVLMAGAYLAPNATVLVFFLLPMRLKTVAYALVAIAIFTLFTGGHNAGGEAGHLGGALAGFYFIRNPKHLHDFFDVLGRIDPTSHHYRHKGAPARSRAVSKLRRTAGGGPSREQIDRVLDKVHTQGLASLSDKEKRILREASQRDG
jgi:membrane associated rhomboid family serine protease